MKAKHGIILACLAIIALNILFFVTSGMTSTMKGNGGVQNSVEDAHSISELEGLAGYDFNIPEFLLNENDISYEVVNGTNIQVYNTRFKFCVAPFIAYNISIVGNYNEFEFDRYYTITDDAKNNDGITYLRYRTDGVTTIVEWFTPELMYGLQMENYEGYQGMDALMDGISNGNFTTNQLIETDKPESSTEGTHDPLENENLISDGESNTQTSSNETRIDGELFEENMDNNPPPQPAPPPVEENTDT